MNATVRCAIYARYSSDLQRLTSIEDQLRRCREYATQQGWTVVEEFVRCDEARSAATLAGRDALQSLLAASKSYPSPFDCLVVDDTSRLARYLPDVLKMNDSLQYHGVFIYAVAQRLDCREKTSRPLLTLHGMMDEQFLVSLGEKVHRGQEDRALSGFQPGGKCYGYNNVPIEDPTRNGKYGRFAISGVKLEIAEEEAVVVRRIFQMYADGSSQAAISKTLNAEGVLAPNPPRTRHVRAWCVSSIFEMLRNERYRGVFVWNRTKKERNPETGRKTSRPRPESDWKRIDVPEWRIVSEELWEQAQARKRFAGKRFSASHLGGSNRSERSKRYIFSGFLVCGVCGSKLVIASGSGKRGYVKYGCPSHRYRGTCSNGLMIRQDRLEAQLIAGLTERISKSELIEYALKRFQEQLQKRLRDIQEQTLKAADTISTLQNQRRELKARANNIGEAIAQMGHSATLLQQLAMLESEIQKIDERLAVANQPLDLAFSLESIRDFVSDKALDFRAAFDAEPGKAKEILAGHIDQLVLTPRATENGTVYEVSGDIDLFGGDGKAMSLVVEAYTGRSSKQRGHRTLQREALTQYSSKQERVMAFDPVSGHHHHYASQSRGLCSASGIAVDHRRDCRLGTRGEHRRRCCRLNQPHGYTENITIFWRRSCARSS
jgi:site-specific DNA recombinase